MKDETKKLVMGTTKERNGSWKLGARALGIAESFSKKDSTSTVVGIVMRGDLRIDGFGLCHPTVGGLDATEKIISMYQNLNRPDIRVLLLGGTIISWFNIVDLNALYEAIGLPAISVTYEETDGIETYIREYFPSNYKQRIEILRATGERRRISLENDQCVFVNSVGISIPLCRDILNTFILDGKIPEPIRVSRLIAGVLRNRLTDT